MAPYQYPIEPDDEKPKTETVAKTAKKSFINWLVPLLGGAILFACFTVAKSWADDRYPQKKDLAEEIAKREIVDTKVQDIERKLDLIIYILQQRQQDPNLIVPQKGKNP